MDRTIIERNQAAAATRVAQYEVLAQERAKEDEVEARVSEMAPGFRWDKARADEVAAKLMKAKNVADMAEDIEQAEREKIRVAEAAERARVEVDRKVKQRRIDQAKGQRDSFVNRNKAARKVKSGLSVLRRKYGEHPKWDEEQVRSELEGGQTTAQIGGSFEAKGKKEKSPEQVVGEIAEDIRKFDNPELGGWSSAQLQEALPVSIDRPEVRAAIEKELKRRGGEDPQTVEDWVEYMAVKKGSPLTDEEKRMVRERYGAR